MYKIDKERIDAIIKELEKLKEKDDIEINTNSGIMEVARTFDSVYYKKYVDINIVYNDLIENKLEVF